MIIAQELYFSYSGTPPFILDGINFEILRGKYVSIAGDNGSGKTTLMRLALKMIKPSSGNISILAGRVGYVPQRSAFINTGFPITVFEMLNSYRRILKVGNRDEVMQTLALVGIEAFANTLIENLSGGQCQKALIARALIGCPDLLILDEPSTGIDSCSQEDIYGILKSLNTEKGITVVSVEHNLKAAISNSAQIYHLSNGAVHVCTPQQYVDEYLKKPYDNWGGGNA